MSADFSGKWVLNVTKSEFGDIPLYAAVKQFDIKQNNDSIFIKKITIDENNHEKETTENISFNSQPSIQILDNKRTKKSAAQWSSNGQVLTIANNYSLPGEPEKIDYSFLQTWSLTEDGKELNVNLKSPTYSIKAIYDKQ
jgi:hypothetical protein